MTTDGPQSPDASALYAGFAIAGICLLLAGVGAGDMLVIEHAHGTPFTWTDIVGSVSPHWIVLALTLPGVLQLALRWPPWPLARRSVAVHACAFFAVSVIHAVAVALSMWITTPPIFGFAARFIRGWTSSMSIVVPMYGATLLAAWALTEARERRARQLREARLELQLQAARLEALRAQLRPHFLFNTLNSISALVADAQRDRATHALDQLADLLHASYRDDGAGMIPLGDEIALAGQYLALQQLRFADRLQHEIHVSPEAARSLVPALILQPLVENAVIHGLALRDGPMRVGIDARLREGALVVTIDNDGRDLPAGWQPKRTEGGVGLTNTRARIESAYGRDANLTVRPRPSGGARAVLSIRVAVPSSPIHSARREATEPA